MGDKKLNTIVDKAINTNKRLKKPNNKVNKIEKFNINKIKSQKNLVLIC